MRPSGITVRNVNHALPRAVNLLKERGAELPSRNGVVLEYPGMFYTTYLNPCERVLFDPARNAHPYFHFFEALWILAGRDDVQWISFFLKNIAQYSDDGRVFRGAYGKRMRNHFDHDQLPWLISHLKKDPLSRRAVITLFDSNYDHVDGQDIPCNLACDFLIREGALHLTVFNRSNDVLWGAYGANVVQFSTLLELVSNAVGVPVGTYTQVSNSFHVYTDTDAWKNVQGMSIAPVDPYECATYYNEVWCDPITTFPLPHGYANWERDLNRFMVIPQQGYIKHDGYFETSFFNRVVVPLYNSFVAYRGHDTNVALAYAAQCRAPDWRMAVEQWLIRRAENAAKNV